MLGQTATGTAATTEAGRRIFRIEYEGLRQNEETNRSSYSIRRSGPSSVTVSYGKLNEEMQRLNRLGARILKVEPLTAGKESNLS
ncbi:phycobilisome linker polypeptide [Leptolyngbya sp. FACHB-261]|uniref:phycobilisome linker polypeptide n=1 Tax=Leptolyngbya sp. FACHB-261 TaxID=2692806 RepID=UPI001686A034|nr:phycobilisome linker polypeptide [Leptolyngbya sp. FACHB-261]MBD2104508.1 phycobilisome linker polypeptide [Leptolyngbya sp. FACHB-261]